MGKMVLQDLQSHVSQVFVRQGADQTFPAGSAVSLDEALQAVTALGIMSGDGAMSQRVTRAQFITMAIKASPGGDGVGQAATSPYPDVPRSHWASGYVEAGVARGLISGFSDGTFRPDQEVKLAEAVSIVLALLGYGPEDFSGAYPSGQMAMFHSLKLDRGVSASGAQALITRQDAVYLFYDLLSAKTREGTPYIQLLGHALDASGKPDLVSLINGEMEGPVVAQGSWKSSLSFAPQKGVADSDIDTLANALSNYIDAVDEALYPPSNQPRFQGAAGGLGYAFHRVLRCPAR
jgi:hypothetical protein